MVELDGIADREALKRRLVEAGVWVRPFGNVVYLTPALTIADDELAVLMRAVVDVLRQQRP
ncbi:adenosylmethionine--8-amino-7-oxononanoate transaminase [compost metagenome]